MVWHWESGCPIHGIAHLVLVISAVAVTRSRHSSARKERSICITLICPSAHRYCEEVLFGTIRICILSQPGPVLWVAHAKAGATRPGTAPRDRGSRAEGEGASLGGQQRCSVPRPCCLSLLVSACRCCCCRCGGRVGDQASRLGSGIPAGLPVGDGTTASGRTIACHAQPHAQPCKCVVLCRDVLYLPRYFCVCCAVLCHVAAVCYVSGSVPVCRCAGRLICLVGAHSLIAVKVRREKQVWPLVPKLGGAVAWTPPNLQLPLSEDGNMQASIPGRPLRCPGRCPGRVLRCITTFPDV